MGNKTNIEWTDETWNFLRGCSRVSEGCRNCYAERIAARFSGPGMPYERLAEYKNSQPRWTGEVRFDEKTLLAPMKWRKPRRVFVNSMSDLFHEKVKGKWLDQAFAVMALTPHITYQILTKRPDRMLDYFQYYNIGRDHNRADYIADAIAKLIGRPGAKGGERIPDGLSFDGPVPNNVWLGVSAEDRETYLHRVPYLTMAPGTTKFLSFEPLLGDIGDLMLDGIFEGSYQWAIAGGESGPHARPTHPDWIRSIRDQCKAAGVPFFFKQGSQANWPKFKDFDAFPEEFQIREFPNA